MFKNLTLEDIVIIVAAAVIILWPSPSHADEWTDADIKREVAFLVLQFIDYGQTRTIAKHPENYHEFNEILGSHPSVSKVNKYFAVTTLLQLVVADKWTEYRTEFQYLTIGIEVGAVGNNVMIGIHHDFF